MVANFFHERDPSRRQARNFIYRHNHPENSILIAGKSVGGVKIHVKVLDEIEVELAYKKVAVVSIDPYGYHYGHQRLRPQIVFPAWPFESTPPQHIKVLNFYHRNGGFEGATVVAPSNSGIQVENVLLDKHTQDFSYYGNTLVHSGDDVKHMNIVFHADVSSRIKCALQFLA